MKKSLFFLISALISINVNAGRSAPTGIKNIVVKAEYVEIWTDNEGGDCTTSNGWHLMNSHPNFEAIYSGFLASKASDKKVDIVGTGNCNGNHEIISWSYVVI